MRSPLLALTAVLFFFVVAASSDQQHDNPLRSAFTDWMRTHSKSYSTEEFIFRWNVWCDNHHLIEEHNRQNHSHRLGMNQFGDLTVDEFRKLYTPSMAPASDFDAAAPINNTTSEAAAHGLTRRLPASLDWRTWGGVQAVKNQGFFRMARCKNMCGIADWAAYPTA